MPTFLSMGNKPNYESSEANETSNSHFEEETKHIKYTELFSTTEDNDILIKKNQTFNVFEFP